MKNNKASDKNGIIAEMLKQGTSRLWDMVLDLFNDIMVCGQAPPDEWKSTRLIVIVN